jgi:hypothetical protein
MGRFVLIVYPDTDAIPFSGSRVLHFPSTEIFGGEKKELLSTEKFHLQLRHPSDHNIPVQFEPSSLQNRRPKQLESTPEH